MYKHLQLRFLQNVEDATGIVFLMKRCKATVWYRNDVQNVKKWKKNKQKNETQQCCRLAKGHKSDAPDWTAGPWHLVLEWLPQRTKLLHKKTPLTIRSKRMITRKLTASPR